MKHVRVGAAVVGLASTALLAPMVAPASAATSRTVVTGLQGPLGLAITPNGGIIVADSTGISAFNSVGGRKVLVRGQGIEGVDESGGVVSFTKTLFPASNPRSSLSSKVYARYGNGSTKLILDARAYEKKYNPDAKYSYGFQGLPAACAKQVPASAGGGSPYKGIVDSHAYGVARRSDGTRYVADAAGNDILRVSPYGSVSTLAVLPPQALRVTAANAKATGLPSCTVGYYYYFEAVPTDVEVGPYGTLYVTTLPGGPETPALGARGSVYKVSMTTGAVTRIARYLAGATGVAVTPRGGVYVDQLFGNQVSRISNGVQTKVLSVTQPAALEYSRGSLYTTANVLGPGGRVVKIDVPGGVTIAPH